MRKILISLALCLSLGGCLSMPNNISLDGSAATAAATAGAVAGVALGGPLVGMLSGAAAGLAADSALEPQSPYLYLPEEERADALKAEYMWDALKGLGYWSIFFAFLFFLIPGIIGYFIPNRKQRQMAKYLHNDPNHKME